MAFGFSNSINLGGAEIVSYSKEHNSVLVITGGSNLELLAFNGQQAPTRVSTLTLSGPVQSVDVSGDLVAVAVADATNPKSANGHVAFYRLSGSGLSATLTELGKVTVGALPDSVSFNSDGKKLVVANEGEVIDATTSDAPGTISVIDTSSFGPTTTTSTGFTVKTVTFEAFNTQAARLNLQGIRISGGSQGATVAQDFEPESIAILGTTAWVTLQENNAVAEIDLVTGTLTKIWGMGIKDWSRGTAKATNYTFSLSYPTGTNNNQRPDFNSNGAVNPGEVTAGGLSGAVYGGIENGQDIFYVITDRGPQAAAIGDRPNDNPSDANKTGKIFDDPDFPITIYKLAQTPSGFQQLQAITLKVPDGNGGFRSATGIGALATHDKGFQLTQAGNGIVNDPGRYNVYAEIPRDAFGLDTESINLITVASLNNGKPMFAVSDEYFPQIALFDSETGNLVRRYVPSGTDFTGVTYQQGRGDVSAYTLATLPAVYANRLLNRGFEGMAFNSKDGLLYAFVQSALQPTGYKNSEFIRILAIDPATGTPKAEYLHLLDADSKLAGSAKVDKIGDAVYDAARERFLLIERDSLTGSSANKSVVEIDLTGATNVLGFDWNTALGVNQPELLDTPSIADALAAKGIQMVQRTELLNIPSVGANPAFDKPEGLALKPDGTLVVFNDNDFVAVDGRADNSAAVISFKSTPIDTSNTTTDAGGAMGIKDVYGLPMADGITAYQSKGVTYLIAAGEGDDRNGDLKTGGLHINDATRSKDLKGADRANLGDRLNLINSEGDYNKDGTLDQAYAFGSRSFRIYDTKGNLVFDSGNQLDEIAKTAGIYDDGRSDDKGMEPEMVTTKEINGRVFAFIGMERGTSSAIAVYDVTDPSQATFFKLLQNVNSISPEGLEFVSTDSDGSGFLLAANEVSGTLDTYQVNLKTIGETTALIPQAGTSTAPEHLIDGRSGRTDFPNGTFKALATVGEVDKTTGLALTGWPDGNAAWLLNDTTIRVAFQSESYATSSNQTYAQPLNNGKVTFTGSKTHYIDYDREGFADFLKTGDTGADIVKGSGFLFDTLYNVFGEVVDGKNTDKTDLSAKWGNQTKPDGTFVEFSSAPKDMRLTEADFHFHSFCGSWYEQAEKYGDNIGFADNVWFMAEEWNMGPTYFGGAATANDTMGLASMVIDVANKTAYTVPVLGQGGYEKLLPINPGHKDYVAMVLSGYNHDKSAPNRIYIGIKDKLADGTAIDYNTASARDSFLARNGLLHGKIYGLALSDATYTTLGINPDADQDLLIDDKSADSYLKSATAPDNIQGRFYGTSYQWGGFDKPKAVKDTDMNLWEKAAEQPTGYKFFTADSKIEHSAVDPDTSKVRFVQNMTASGGILGFDLTNTISQELIAANGALPQFLSVNVNRVLPAIEGALTLDTNGAGEAHVGKNNLDGSQTAAKHLGGTAPAAKAVAPDGLLWVKNDDGDFLIVDEDSGNVAGERKYVLSLDSTTLALKEKGTGDLLAIAGGADNPRAKAKVAAMEGAFTNATGAEFSGSWNVTALVARDAEGNFYTPEELQGTKAQTIANAIPLSEQLFIGVVQMGGESSGQVKDVKADYGGQIFQFSVDLGLDEAKTGTSGADNSTSMSSFDGVMDTVFTGAGEDVIDIATPDGHSNVIFAGSGNDTVFANARDIITGGSGNDTLRATILDNNRLEGGSGVDTFFVGTTGNRVLGGKGDDLINVLGGAGTNYLNGGAGSDQFWLISESTVGDSDMPDAKQFVMDFKAGEDKVGLRDVAFSSLSFTQVGGDTLLKVGVFEVGHFANVSASVLNNQSNFAGLTNLI